MSNKTANNLESIYADFRRKKMAAGEQYYKNPNSDEGRAAATRYNIALSESGLPLELASQLKFNGSDYQQLDQIRDQQTTKFERSRLIANWRHSIPSPSSNEFMFADLMKEAETMPSGKPNFDLKEGYSNSALKAQIDEIENELIADDLDVYESPELVDAPDDTPEQAATPEPVAVPKRTANIVPTIGSARNAGIAEAKRESIKLQESSPQLPEADEYAGFSAIRNQVLNAVTPRAHIVARLRGEIVLYKMLDKIYDKLEKKNDPYADPKEALKDIFMNVAAQSRATKITDKSAVIQTILALLNHPDLKKYASEVLKSPLSEQKYGSYSSQSTVGSILQSELKGCEKLVTTIKHIQAESQPEEKVTISPRK